MTDLEPLRDESEQAIVERALGFVAEFQGDQRCGLNCYHAEALAREVRRLRALLTARAVAPQEEQWLGVKGVEEAYTALAAPARAEREWQPIETAPKDGTGFLACAQAGSVFWAHWANGVVDGASWTDDGGYEDRHATYWMPLPEPPAARLPRQEAEP